MPPGIYKRKLKSFKERFEKKIGNKNNCWIWIGRKSIFGYGQFFMKGKLEQAHRASWKIYKGIIPRKLCVCHSCDNRSCVNPKHLWLGTRNDNVQDMIKKGRDRKAPSDKNGSAKLTWQKVNKIRKIRKEKKVYYKDLAKMFNVHYATIKRIITNKTWNI